MTYTDHGCSPGSGSLDVAVRQLDGDVILVDTAGEIDLATHGGLKESLFDVLAPPSPGLLVADLSKVTFFDSSGISTVVDAHQRAQTVGTELRIVCDGRAVMRPLVITSVDRYLNVYSDRATAVETPVSPMLDVN
ncbi:STAS domain-containing protein [Haloechinothrix salitolerans]|uniref:Anti-sigma factor antagonist n=1 Tax=Haloechinothrix salitolerans TaxID=926830 RepID=A0ABW2C1W8_9PSEU